MSIRQQAARGVFWSAVQNWGSALIGGAVLLVLLRLLDRSAFGLLAMASACVAIVETLLRQGLGQALIQRAEVKAGHLDTAFWASIVTGALLMVLGVAGAGLVSDILNEPRLPAVLRWLSLSFLVGGLSSTHQAVLIRNMAFKALAVRSLVAVLVGGLVGIWMALSGCGVWSLVGQTLVTSVVGTVVLWMATDWRPGFHASMARFEELFTFSVHAMGIEILTVLNVRSVDLLIGFFLGAERLAYFSVAYQLFTLITRALIQTVSVVALPSFSRLQHDIRQMRNAYWTATEMCCLVGFPAFAGMAAVAPEIVYGAIGHRWEPSIPVIQVLALLGILQSALYYNRILLMASGRPGWVLKLSTLTTLLTVGVVGLVARWGVLVVAVALTARSLVLGPISIWMCRRVVDFPPRELLRRVASPLWASLLMLLWVWGTKELLGSVLQPSALLATSIALGAAVYALAIVVFAPALAKKALDLLRVAVGGAPTKTILPGPPPNTP